MAVIKIDRTGLLPLSSADSDSLRQGQIVLAHRNPMALENSVSMRVISSQNRAFQLDDPAVYIQTDAPINPGNSGGALVDIQGRLAGINTFILSQSGGSEGIGFAIPANVVKRVYAELRKPAGVLVAPRVAGLPESEEGFVPGDLIISLNGKAVPNVEALRGLLGNLRAGSPVVLRIQREDQLRFIVLDLP